MIRILLVDDDYLALNAFFAIADWYSLGYEIAYEAKNGEEALRICAAHTFDVAFLDVHLPDIDGITLIHQMKHRLPNIAIVMLSNYSDFVYVRDAMKLGACDYLLKHEITRDSILEVLANIGFPAKQPQDTVRTQSVLETLLSGDTDVKADGYLCVGEPAQAVSLIPAVRDSILKTSRHVFYDAANCCVAFNAAGKLFFWFDGQSMPQYSEKFHQLQRLLRLYYNIQYVFTAPEYYQDSSPLRERLDTKDISSPDKNTSLYATLLSCAIRLGCMQKVEVYAQCLFDFCAHSSLQNSYRDLFAEVLSVSMLEIPDFLSALTICKAQAKRNQEKRLSHFSNNVANAICFIEEHYNEDISLKDVASYCYISYSHLSFIFKKETGQGINHYLNAIRVQRAAMLLYEGRITSESVSADVGFVSYSHFYTAFKNTTGIAPSAFCNIAQCRTWLEHYEPLSGDASNREDKQ